MERKLSLGIDCGSTTTKHVLIGEDKSILYSYYSSISTRFKKTASITEKLEKQGKQFTLLNIIIACVLAEYGTFLYAILIRGKIL